MCDPVYETGICNIVRPSTWDNISKQRFYTQSKNSLISSLSCHTVSFLPSHTMWLNHPPTFIAQGPSSECPRSESCQFWLCGIGPRCYGLGSVILDVGGFLPGPKLSHGSVDAKNGRVDVAVRYLDLWNSVIDPLNPSCSSVIWVKPLAIDVKDRYRMFSFVNRRVSGNVIIRVSCIEDVSVVYYFQQRLHQHFKSIDVEGELGTVRSCDVNINFLVMFVGACTQTFLDLLCNGHLHICSDPTDFDRRLFCNINPCCFSFVLVVVCCFPVSSFPCYASCAGLTTDRARTDW